MPTLILNCPSCKAPIYREAGVRGACGCRDGLYHRLAADRQPVRARTRTASAALVVPEPLPDLPPPQNQPQLLRGHRAVEVVVDDLNFFTDLNEGVDVDVDLDTPIVSRIQAAVQRMEIREGMPGGGRFRMDRDRPRENVDRGLVPMDGRVVGRVGQVGRMREDDPVPPAPPTAPIPKTAQKPPAPTRTVYDYLCVPISDNPLD